MPNIFDNLEKTISGLESRKQEYDPYYYFEPWDCDVPPPSTVEYAREDGVSLVTDESIKLAGEYPRTFQTGSINSVKKMVVAQAGSRSGKSITTQVVIGAMISRRPPYAFRYEKGVDTGIKRIVCPANIRRFGRRDVDTGSVIDYDEKAKPSPRWDCGNITGAGKFPAELYCPPGKQIWIGTIAKSVDTFWWPAFNGSGEARFFPREFIDTSKGNKGFNKQAGIIHCLHDIDVHIKTYEQGHTKFESQTAWLLAYDEEPPGKEIYLSGALHATYQRFTFTPLNGRTWSEDIFFACVRGKKGGLRKGDFDYFYASQFDSPYVEQDKLLRDRRAMALWERKARIWGQYSAFEGEPFFNRSKIQRWMESFPAPYRCVRFEAAGSFFGVHGSRSQGIPGILNVEVQARTVPEASETEMLDAWRVYENVRQGCAYCMVMDAAEGAIDPRLVKDKSFGLVFRPPMPDEVAYDNLPIIVATIRSALPIVELARKCLPVLRYYNNAVLAAERGRGKDNEAFGMTLEEWPYWYYRAGLASGGGRNTLKRSKGFDTNKNTRTILIDKVREWLDTFEEDEDPNVRDLRIYGELAGAVVAETPGGKKRCDHTKSGSLDGVICLGIATYVLQESPDAIVCNRNIAEEKRVSFLERTGAVPGAGEPRQRVSMGSGVFNLGGRL
jgi:phage terminase large subunit-like protein